MRWECLAILTIGYTLPWQGEEHKALWDELASFLGPPEETKEEEATEEEGKGAEGA